MVKYPVIELGEYKWYVLKTIGDKYYLLAENPLFRGYYSLHSCAFSESKLFSFLTTKFVMQLSHGGLDTQKISNLSIPTTGQYSIYIKDKLPPASSPYLLQTPHPRQEDCMLAINEDGEMFPCPITEQCGIRPCMFVEKEYVNALFGYTQDLQSEIIEPEAIHEESSDIVSEVPTQSEIEALNEINEIDESIFEEMSENEILEWAEKFEKEDFASTLEDIDDVTIETDDTDTTDIEENIVIESSTKEQILSIVNAEKEPDIVYETNETLTAETVEEDNISIVDPDTKPVSENNELQISDEPPAPIKETDITEEHITTKDNRNITIKQIGTSKAVYLFDDFKDYAVLVEGGEEEINKVISAYGMTIQDFSTVSRNEKRDIITAESILQRIKNNQDRWQIKEKHTQKEIY